MAERNGENALLPASEQAPPEFVAWVEQFNRDHSDLVRIRRQARRLITLGIKAGRDPLEATTVGQVAKACRIEPAEVARMIENYAHLMGVTKGDGPPESWIVWEDGE